MTFRVMTFEELFGRPPAVTARAPGRVNLIGEHTDYNDGFVLPAPIPQLTEVQIARSPDGGRTVRAWSANLPERGIASYRLGEERRQHDWIDYVAGITKALRDVSGLDVSGFDLRITSDVPLGSGLSSSASLEIALLRGLREAFGLALSDVDLARIGQRAENDLVGAPVGIMDQMAASLCRPGEVLFLDTADLTFEPVALPASLELVVIDSLVRHSHASSEYRTRREECEQACAALGIPSLRALDQHSAGPAAPASTSATHSASASAPASPSASASDALLDRLAALPEPLGRRARHVVTENRRVRQMVEALRKERLEECGRLLYEGHASMRDAYEITVPAIDLLVEIARAQPDVLGARMTGGGFGGSIVVLTRTGAGRDAADAIVRTYRQQSGNDAMVLVPR
jgi:galactokinase